MSSYTPAPARIVHGRSFYLRQTDDVRRRVAAVPMIIPEGITDAEHERSILALIYGTGLDSDEGPRRFHSRLGAPAELTLEEEYARADRRIRREEEREARAKAQPGGRAPTLEEMLAKVRAAKNARLGALGGAK